MEFTDIEKKLMLQLLSEPNYTSREEALVAKSIAVKLGSLETRMFEITVTSGDEFFVGSLNSARLASLRDYGLNPQEVCVANHEAERLNKKGEK
jgi:hypothetical protein